MKNDKSELPEIFYGEARLPRINVKGLHWRMEKAGRRQMR